MTRKRTLWVISSVFVVITLCATLLLGSAFSTVQPPAVSNVIGADGSYPFRNYSSGFTSSIILNAAARKVSFLWKHSVAPVQLGGNPQSHVETQAVWFYPNYAEWLDDSDLLVAGISPRDGSSVIEIWEYENEPGKPGLVPISYPTNGQPGVIWNLPQRQSVTLVWQELIQGMDTVIYAKENLGLPGHAFVRFKDSGDLYDLNIAAGTMTLEAAGQGGAPLIIPELAEASAHWVVGGAAVEHAQEGYVYGVFTKYDEPGPEISVYLLDSDMDGGLDGFTTSDPTGYLMGDEVTATH